MHKKFRMHADPQLFNVMDCYKLVYETLEQAAFAKVSRSLPPKKHPYMLPYMSDTQTHTKHTSSD